MDGPRSRARRRTRRAAGAAGAAPPARPCEREPLDEFFYRPDEEAGALGALDALAEQERPRPAEAPPRRYLGFKLAGEDYAVALEEVREIARIPPIAEVPRAPPLFAGVMSLRGEVIPIFDLRRRLGLPALPGPPGPQARVVVVRAGDAGSFGVIVDSVEQVVRMSAAGLETPPSSLGRGAAAECIGAIGRARDTRYAILDLGAALGRSRGAPA